MSNTASSFQLIFKSYYIMVEVNFFNKLYIFSLQNSIKETSFNWLALQPIFRFYRFLNIEGKTILIVLSKHIHRKVNILNENLAAFLLLNKINFKLNLLNFNYFFLALILLYWIFLKKRAKHCYALCDFILVFPRVSQIPAFFSLEEARDTSTHLDTDPGCVGSPW